MLVNIIDVTKIDTDYASVSIAMFVMLAEEDIKLM